VDGEADLGDAEFVEEVDGDEEIVERRAVCVFDFTAEYDGEISIEAGQVVWVEFRKGVSGWLVVRDEITGHSSRREFFWADGVESKGLVPEGYVRFLNEEEERQYFGTVATIKYSPSAESGKRDDLVRRGNPSTNINRKSSTMEYSYGRPPRRWRWR
jgi:hypothetical protein